MAVPYQTQSPRVLQQFGYQGANAHSHKWNQQPDGKQGFPKSHITLLVQPDSFCWLHKPESWSNTIFSCRWGGFKSSCTGRNWFCWWPLVSQFITCGPGNVSWVVWNNSVFCSEQRQWKGYATAVQIFLVNQIQKSMPGSHLLWHCWNPEPRACACRCQHVDLHGSLGCGSLAGFACTISVSFTSSDNGIWCPQHEASCGTGSATLTQAHLRGAGSRETAAKMQDPGPLTGRTWQDSKQQNWKCRGRGGEEAEQTRGLILPRADFNRLHGGQDYSILNSGSAGNWEIEPYRGPWLAEGEVK